MRTLVLATLVLFLSALLTGATTSPQLAQRAPVELTPHPPIAIGDSASFTERNGVRSGSGTQTDPYIIEGWLIDVSTASTGIQLSRTSAYVIIRDCEVRNMRSVGILINYASHVTVENCHVTGSNRGFQITGGQDVHLIGNLADLNREGGFFIYQATGVEMTSNASYYNWEASLGAVNSWGIYVDEHSEARGNGNLSAGHSRAVTVRKILPSGGNPIDLFSNPAQLPETSCTQIFTEFFLFIGRLQGTQPLTEPYCALLLSVLRSLPDGMRGQIAQFILMPDSEEFAGSYTGVGTVRLYANLTHLKAFTSTVYHEIAHVLQDRMLSASEKQRWSQLHDRSGADSDNYPIQDADSSTRANLGLLHYGMRNQFEDFASTVEEYTQDSLAMALRAQRIEQATGKTILREKIGFIISLFRGQPFVYQKLVDWNSQTDVTRVRIQRAQALRLENGLPVAAENLVWEEF